MRYRLLFIILMFIAPLSRLTAQSGDLKTLAKWIAGSYSSREQHLQDSANYFDIRLQIIPIWKDRSDGFWYYVEQAVADFQDRPYRQRVYRIFEPQPGIFESVVYTMNDPLRFTRRPDLVEKLPLDSLSEKEGCSVILKKKDGVFSGGTVGKKCPSDRRGAAYATSEVTISETMLLSWDRGYDAAGNQAWGADKGGYRFVKSREQ